MVKIYRVRNGTAPSLNGIHGLSLDDTKDQSELRKVCFQPEKANSEAQTSSDNRGPSITEFPEKGEKSLELHRRENPK